MYLRVCGKIAIENALWRVCLGAYLCNEYFLLEISCKQAFGYNIRFVHLTFIKIIINASNFWILMQNKNLGSDTLFQYMFIIITLQTLYKLGIKAHLYLNKVRREFVISYLCVPDLNDIYRRVYFQQRILKIILVSMSIDDIKAKQ